MTWLELRYWRQLSISTLVGIPELSQQRKGRLLREGIYGVVCRPRYLSAGIGMIANALIVNYLGVYVLLMAIVRPGYLMLVLEERDSLVASEMAIGVSAGCSTTHSTPAKDG